LIIVIALFVGAVNVGIITFEKDEIKDGYAKIINNLENNTTTVNQSENIATIIIEFGDGNSLTYDMVIENATVYDLLLEADKNGDINIEPTYWEQYDSYLIDSIIYNGKKYEGGTNAYWSFYVNGEAAMEGANKILVNNNDIINWRFEKI